MYHKMSELCKTLLKNKPLLTVATNISLFLIIQEENLKHRYIFRTENFLL